MDSNAYDYTSTTGSWIPDVDVSEGVVVLTIAQFNQLAAAAGYPLVAVNTLRPRAVPDFKPYPKDDIDEAWRCWWPRPVEFRVLGRRRSAICHRSAAYGSGAGRRMTPRSGRYG